MTADVSYDIPFRPQAGRPSSQAIVITTAEAQTLAFLTAYWNHPLADPNHAITESFTSRFRHLLPPPPGSVKVA